MLSFYDYQFFTKNIMTDSLKMVIKSNSPTVRYRHLRKSQQECSEHVFAVEILACNILILSFMQTFSFKNY